jgi:Glycosyltransferase family 87
VTARKSEFVPVTLALALFLFAWATIHVGFYEHEQIVDTPVYEKYATAMEDGEVPYRDFDVEYPPAALPVFVVPALVGDDYRTSFEWLMALCGGGTILAVALAARRLSLGFGTLAFVALASLAVGSVILTRFDLWPSMLAAFALAALVHDRLRLGHALLAVAVLAKIYPGVFLPLALAYVWRRRGRREALVCAGIFAAVVVVVYLPFLLIAPEGVASSLGRQLSRPLQIESLGSAVLLAAHDLFGVDVEMRSSHGSQNLAGTAAGVVAVVLSLAQVVVLVWLWARFARRAATPSAADLAVACAAVLTAFVALGKVLSPQFLIWLVPVVPLAARLGANALLAAALVLTQLWFPYRYWDLARDLDPNVAWLVLARDVVLVALVVLLARAVAAPDLPGARHRPRLERPWARRASPLPERR